MTRSKPVVWTLLAPLLLAGATLVAGHDANASDYSLSLGEVATPPASFGFDLSSLKNAAEGELRGVDISKVRRHRNVLVSVAIIGSEQAPFGCTVNALLRDAKTGTMLAILEGRAKAQGSANASLRRDVLRAALRSAVSKIPEALASN